MKFVNSYLIEGNKHVAKNKRKKFIASNKEVFYIEKGLTRNTYYVFDEDGNRVVNGGYDSVKRKDIEYFIEDYIEDRDAELKIIQGEKNDDITSNVMENDLKYFLNEFTKAIHNFISKQTSKSKSNKIPIYIDSTDKELEIFFKLTSKVPFKKELMQYIKVNNIKSNSDLIVNLYNKSSYYKIVKEHGVGQVFSGEEFYLVKNPS